MKGLRPFLAGSGMRGWYSDYITCSTAWSSKRSRYKRVSSSPNRPGRIWGLHSFQLNQ